MDRWRSQTGLQREASPRARGLGLTIWAWIPRDVPLHPLAPPESSLAPPNLATTAEKFPEGILVRGNIQLPPCPPYKLDNSGGLKGLPSKTSWNLRVGLGGIFVNTGLRCPEVRARGTMKGSLLAGAPTHLGWRQRPASWEGEEGVRLEHKRGLWESPLRSKWQDGASLEPRTLGA